MFLCIALVVLELTLASGWPQTYHQSAEIEGMHQPACLTQIDFLRLELLNLFVFLLNLRIVSLSVLSLQSEFQDDQDYTEKPYLGKKKRENSVCIFPANQVMVPPLCSTALHCVF